MSQLSVKRALDDVVDEVEGFLTTALKLSHAVLSRLLCATGALVDVVVTGPVTLASPEAIDVEVHHGRSSAFC